MELHLLILPVYYNPSGELGIESYNCGDAEITYDSKLNITFNTKPESCTVNLITWKNNNAPVLVAGMTPVKWNASNVESTTTASDSEWYDYSAKKWANAKTADGSYWVWVPRYAYKITSGYHTGGELTAGEIDVKFLVGKGNLSKDGTKIETSGYNADTKNTSMHYFTHPAFTFGSEEITGIWVAKYEASVNPTSDACYTSESAANCNKTTLIPAFKSNIKSWRFIQIGNIYEVAYNLKSKSNYGWNGTTVDTHLIKNTEWGAVAYLAQSAYGANQEVWINNNNTYVTGCAGSSVSAGNYAGCQNAYNTSTGGKASTTHNITGIYDMSGGTYEYTASYVNNGDGSLTTNGSQIISANAKYKDVYAKGSTDSASLNYEANKNKYGDAFYEISKSYENSNSWYEDVSGMPYSTSPWFLRGGHHNSTTGAGLFFYFPFAGASDIGSGFRAVAIIP